MARTFPLPESSEGKRTRRGAPPRTPSRLLRAPQRRGGTPRSRCGSVRLHVAGRLTAADIRARRQRLMVDGAGRAQLQSADGVLGQRQHPAASHPPLPEALLYRSSVLQPPSGGRDSHSPRPPVPESETSAFVTPRGPQCLPRGPCRAESPTRASCVARSTCTGPSTATASGGSRISLPRSEHGVRSPRMAQQANGAARRNPDLVLSPVSDQVLSDRISAVRLSAPAGGRDFGHSSVPGFHRSAQPPGVEHRVAQLRRRPAEAGTGISAASSRSLCNLLARPLAPPLKRTPRLVRRVNWCGCRRGQQWICVEQGPPDHDSLSFQGERILHRPNERHEKENDDLRAELGTAKDEATLAAKQAVLPPALSVEEVLSATMTTESLPGEEPGCPRQWRCAHPGGVAAHVLQAVPADARAHSGFFQRAPAHHGPHPHDEGVCQEF